MKLTGILARPWFGYLAALALTAIVTGLIALVRSLTAVSNISMLYLLAVLASAALFGIRPAITSAVASFLAFDFFFVGPQYTLTVSKEEEWVDLGLLLVTGIITGQLAAALSDRVRHAERREREAVVLYDIARLTNDPDLQHALTAVAERLRQELALAAVVIDVGHAGPLSIRAEAGDPDAASSARSQVPPGSILGGGEAPTAARRGDPGRWIRLVSPTPDVGRRLALRHRAYKVQVNLHRQSTGSLLLVRDAGGPEFSREDDRLLSAVASQVGLAVERAGLRDEATQAEILRRTDELRTALLNAVSHDLRTPLSSIIASAGSLLQEDVDWTHEERHEFARAIEEDARRLNRLVGNLLDLSRIQAGTLRPDKGWYDLEALIDDVLGRLRPLTAGHTLSANVSDDLPPVLMDYVEIDEVLSNLIENAAKHTPPGTAIRVTARSLGAEVEVSVTDSGPGIPPEAMPHLFEPFYRPSASRPSLGMGLGLAVARGLVEAHGGRISAQNRAEGGTRFAFALPIGESDERRHAPRRTA
jgi:two-component system sensor histidine kinase KdpD